VGPKTRDLSSAGWGPINPAASPRSFIARSMKTILCGDEYSSRAYSRRLVLVMPADLMGPLLGS
jgi:hypothetical protein